LGSDTGRQGIMNIPLLIEKLTKDGYSDEWIKEIVYGLNVVKILEEYKKELN